MVSGSFDKVVNGGSDRLSDKVVSGGDGHFLYLPFQVEEKNPTYRCHIVLPGDPLFGIIISFYEFYFYDIGEALYPILPDGCNNLVFFPLESFDCSIVIKTIKSTEYVSAKQFYKRTVFGIRFFPGRFIDFYHLNPSVCLEQIQPLDALPDRRGNNLRLSASFSKLRTLTFEERVSFFYTYYEKDFIHEHRMSKELQEIYDVFITSKALYSLRQLEESLNYSSRHLRRIFDRYCGFGLKEYLEILRFQFIVREYLDSRRTLGLNELSDRYGFSDRYHFTRFFQKMTGATFKRFQHVFDFDPATG